MLKDCSGSVDLLFVATNNSCKFACLGFFEDSRRVSLGIFESLEDAESKGKQALSEEPALVAFTLRRTK